MSEVPAVAPEKKTKRAAAPAVESAEAFPIRTDVVMPRAAVKRGATCKYPFDALPAPVDGQCASFPVRGKNAKQIQSTVYSAIKRYATLNDAGKIAERVRDFKAVNVDPATDPDSATCRVFRTK